MAYRYDDDTVVDPNDYAAMDLQRPGSNGFHSWTSNMYNYGSMSAPTPEDQAEQQQMLADKSWAFRQRYAQDTAEPTFEQRLTDTDSDLYQSERTEGPPQEGSIELGPEGGAAGPPQRLGFLKFPTQRTLKPESARVIGGLNMLKRSGNTMSTDEFRTREMIKDELQRGRQGNATDESVEGYERKYAEKNRLAAAADIYDRAVKHAQQLSDPAKADEVLNAAWTNYVNATGQTPNGNTGAQANVQVQQGPPATAQPAPAPAAKAMPKPGPDGKYAVKVNGVVVRMTPQELEAEKAKRKAATGAA